MHLLCISFARTGRSDRQACKSSKLASNRLLMSRKSERRTTKSRGYFVFPPDWIPTKTNFEKIYKSRCVILKEWCCKILKNNLFENGTHYFEEIGITKIKLILQIGKFRLQSDRTRRLVLTMERTLSHDQCGLCLTAFEHFQSSGKMPEARELLKLKQMEPAIKSVQTRRSLAEIVCTAVALELLSRVYLTKKLSWSI